MTKEYASLSIEQRKILRSLCEELQDISSDIALILNRIPHINVQDPTLAYILNQLDMERLHEEKDKQTQTKKGFESVMNAPIVEKKQDGPYIEFIQ
jgi:hypothetical protein